MPAQKSRGRGASTAGARPPSQRSLKRKRDEDSREDLEQRISAIDTKVDRFEEFTQLPLCHATAQGLAASHFKTLTDIQGCAIPHALKGSDILGAARTGSGKTLAFLVPLLEKLHCAKWTEFDGLGALVLSPTRELAIQIFDVLRKIGRYHSFSAGLVIGGKSMDDERQRLAKMNILVSTPGRLLQHMDQTAHFDVDNLQMLVLDEADRILDMGFQKTVDGIIEHLPQQRQTLLFSATQTKKVSDLARLSLRDPEYVSVHENAASATPATLKQNYIVTPLQSKLDTLWSFIRSNTKAKILVFLSSGKQVRFVYEAFRHLQPGIPLLHLHGRQKQTARLEVTRKFSNAKHSCLFATDVVARGIDFPAVNWVIQFDCPEDADTYIHRVGRTARYERDGHAVLFLDPSEEPGMLKQLEQKKVTVEKINVREKKQQSIKNQLQNMCFKNPELKYLGQKAFVSYVKSIHVQKDKEVFKLSELPLEELSASLGLPGAPRIKFAIGGSAKDIKNAPRAPMSSPENSEADSDGERLEKKKAGPRTKYDRMFERQNQDIFTNHYAQMIGDHEQQEHSDSLDADKGGFLSVKRRISVSSVDDSEEEPYETNPDREKLVIGVGKEPLLIDSKRREKMLKSKKKLLKVKDRGSKLVFDEDGNPHEIYELADEDGFKSAGPAQKQTARFREEESARLQGVDVGDKAAAKAKRREKRDKRKAREWELAGDNGDEGDDSGDDDLGVTLAPLEDDNVAGQDHLAPTSERSGSEDVPNLVRIGHDKNGVFSRNPKLPRGAARYEDLENLQDLEAVASGLLAR